MNRIKWGGVLAVGVMFLFQAVGRASQVTREQIPADARWVIHIDVDALRTSPIWDILQVKLQDNVEYQAKIKDLESVSGAKFPQDLHSVTLVGTDFVQDNVTVLIHADADVKQILSLLKQNERYDQFQFGTFDVVTWEDQGRQLYGCFFAKDRLVMGRSKEKVEAVLKVIDGKSDPIKADNPLIAGAAAGNASPVIYAAGVGLANLRQQGLAQSPLLDHVKTAWLTLGVQKDNVVAKAEGVADSPEVAEQLRVSAEGLKAIAALAGGDDKADAQAKALAALSKSVEVKAKDASVSLDWQEPLDLIRQLTQTATPASDKPAAK